MTLADLVLAIMFLGVTAYALLGGADFGAGVWDLFAGNPEKGKRVRALIAHTIGPVWEANHVWLIFVLVVIWTCFPIAFGSMMSTLYIPMTFAAIGIMARGAGFAFRKASTTMESQRIFGATFAAASLLTPFFLGAFVGGVASGRVPAGDAAGNVISSWLNPSGMLGGTLAVLVCVYLAAVYLCLDAQRSQQNDLAEQFRIRALLTGVVTGAVAFAGILVLRADSRNLFDGLTERALPLMILSGVSGFLSLVLLWRRAYRTVRITAALAVAAVLWGWATAQYPFILEGTLRISQATGDRDTLNAVIASLAIGSCVLIPALVYLAVIVHRGELENADDFDLAEYDAPVPH